MSKKIIVVGSSNTDMVVRVPHIPAPGETVMGSELLTIQGGKGANQAVGASRAGGDVQFITCISDDAFGRQSLESYENEGIDTSLIKIKPGIHSGVALINVSDDGENSIAVAPGANSHLLPEDIRKGRDAFAGAGIILVQLEIPLETVEAVAELAESIGIPLILNPAPARELPPAILGRISVITPNETEASLLTGIKEINSETIPLMAQALHDTGVKTVIITLGKKGVYLLDREFRGLIPGYNVSAVDTTAAGDIFNGALACALAENRPVMEAVDFAQRAAAISVTRMGAQPSAPQLVEITGYEFNQLTNP